MEEETNGGLEIRIEIELSDLESKPELAQPNEAESGLYNFDEKYFINEKDQPEEIKEEDLAEMLKPKIP